MKTVAIGFIFMTLGSLNSSSAQLGAARGLAPGPDEVVTEALHQAIALEKLPDMSLWMKQDEIEAMVYWSTTNNDSVHFTKLSGCLPKHVDRWEMKEVDSAFVQASSENHDVEYLSIFVHRQRDVYIVDIINDMTVEKGSDKLIIDRGRLTMKFAYKDGVFTLLNLVRGWG